MPQHLLKQRLMKLDENSRANRNAIGVDEWLKEYLTEKYNLFDLQKTGFSYDGIGLTKDNVKAD